MLLSLVKVSTFLGLGRRNLWMRSWILLVSSSRLSLSWHRGSHMSGRQSQVAGRCQMSTDDHGWFARVCDAGPMWTKLTISRNIFPEINRKQNTGSSLSGKTDQYPDSWKRRVRGSEMWKEGRKSVCLTGELATFRQKCPLTSLIRQNAVNLYFLDAIASLQPSNLH